MRDANTILAIHQDRGSRGLPLERVYKQLFDPELFLRAYGKIYRNAGAMTKGSTDETVDGMDLQRIHNIIGLLRWERYAWTPVRRTEIPKANGKMRPLGIPTWSDKLLQEVLRTLLEPYYEQRFSDHSHGFRPHRGCHSALQEVRKTWRGTTWFVEGDIKGCFDNIDHEVLLSIIRRDIHDGRLVKLIEGLLKAGYVKDWRRYDTPSGTPQGGIISPLLANIYLNDLDRFVEDTLIPAYTRGVGRRKDRNWRRIDQRLQRARKRGDFGLAATLERERRQHPAMDPFDPDYRRLRYIRYADDFLLGFAGPKKEAEEIRDRLAEFLEQRLKLALSKEKTLITHAVSERAKFLGYEIGVTRCNTLLDANGIRTTNGGITLLMPRTVVQKVRSLHCRNGKVIHRADMLLDSDYTILQKFQSILRGLYNYYCMATNVGQRNRMGHIKWLLEMSLAKTLANKYKCSVSEIFRRYQVTVLDRKMLRVVVERPGKEPLVAVFGNIPLVRVPDGLGTVDFRYDLTSAVHAGRRTEVVLRLMFEECTLCGAKGPVEMHHIRKLADLNTPGGRPKAGWQQLMAARKRKTLAVCKSCHDKIHRGEYDGPSLNDLLESRMQ